MKALLCALLNSMPHFLASWMVTAISLLITARVVPGIEINSLTAALTGSAAVGLANAIVRPLLVAFAFPLTLVTLGLFLLVVNAICFALASYFTPSGFRVDGFGAAFFGSLFLSLVSSLLDFLFVGRSRR